MATYVEASGELVVIKLGTDGARINAYTLASSLVALADAAKSANAVINPGFEIEVVVEALGEESFKTSIRALYRGASNLFSKETLKDFVLALITNYIIQQAFPPEAQMTVIVNSDEVVVQAGKERVVIPREVHEATKRVRQVPEFRDGIARMFQAV